MKLDNELPIHSKAARLFGTRALPNPTPRHPLTERVARLAGRVPALDRHRPDAGQLLAPSGG